MQTAGYPGLKKEVIFDFLINPCFRSMYRISCYMMNAYGR